MASLVVGSVATDANAGLVISAAFLPVGLATLAAFIRQRKQRQRRAGLIDELWQVYTAEASRIRTGPRHTPRPAMVNVRSRSV
jgi:hypothetical protein